MSISNNTSSTSTSYLNAHMQSHLFRCLLSSKDTLSASARLVVVSTVNHHVGPLLTHGVTYLHSVPQVYLSKMKTSSTCSSWACMINSFTLLWTTISRYLMLAFCLSENFLTNVQKGNALTAGLQAILLGHCQLLR